MKFRDIHGIIIILNVLTTFVSLFSLFLSLNSNFETIKEH